MSAPDLPRVTLAELEALGLEGWRRPDGTLEFTGWSNVYARLAESEVERLVEAIRLSIADIAAEAEARFAAELAWAPAASNSIH